MTLNVHVVNGPSWLDYLTLGAAAVAAVAALVALYFAWRAGRDLVHDRRTVFELQILRELYDAVVQNPGGSSYVRDYLAGDYPALYVLYAEYPTLMLEAMHGVTQHPDFPTPEAFRQWRGERMTRLQTDAKNEILRAVAERTGRRLPPAGPLAAILAQLSARRPTVRPAPGRV